MTAKGGGVITIVTPEDEILSIAFIHNISKDNFEKEYINLLPMNDFEYIRDEIIDNIKDNGIWLGVIESIVKGKKAGAEIINLLKQKHDHIILMADGGTDHYWQAQGFVPIGACMFLW